MRTHTRTAPASKHARVTAACFPLALALLPCLSTVKADETFIIPLDACPGKESCSTSPRALSEHGLVAVGRVNYAGAGSEAFRWVDGEFQMLGFLGTGTFSWAFDVSADGSVAVGRSNLTDHIDPSGPFRWTAETGMVHLLGPNGAPAEGTASGVSADGTVVVGVAQNEAFRWEGGVMTGLGELPGGANYSSAAAVSADGHVIVGGSASESSGMSTEAFRWEDGVMTGLGDLPGGLFQSFAEFVSADGSVVLGGGRDAQGEQGFRWEDGVMTALPRLNGNNTYPEGMSADGTVIVGTSCCAGVGEPWRAFIWDAERGIRAIQTELEEVYGLDLEGWSLDKGDAISGDGRTIVGRGWYEGVQTTWLVRLARLCPADTDDDGVVGVDDLVNVILAWSTSDSGADANDDGIVNVDDLLEVILSWGECRDCNLNQVPDTIDVATGTSDDCDGNGVPDECEDCNDNGMGDACDVGSGTSADCNGNGAPDECDVADGTSGDLDADGVPDECSPDDCNDNGVSDLVDVADGASLDCNGNLVPDECDIADGTSLDCNGNGIPDACDLAGGASADCNANGLPDECEQDCNCNGVDDQADIESGTSGDCDGDGVPDECDPPSNDGCGSATTIGLGEFAFCSAGATGTGPDEPDCPDGVTVTADVWFRHLSQCDGTLTITVDASFAPRLLVYGGPCPSGSGQVVACGAESGPGQVQVTLEMTAGTLLRFRVGSADGSAGTGTVTLSCE